MKFIKNHFVYLRPFTSLKKCCSVFGIEIRKYWNKEYWNKEIGIEIGKGDRRVEKFCFDKPFACQTLAKSASVASSAWEPAKILG